MSLLLNLERPQDAMDYWEPGSPLQAQLTADEVRTEERKSCFRKRNALECEQEGRRRTYTEVWQCFW